MGSCPTHRPGQILSGQSKSRGGQRQHHLQSLGSAPPHPGSTAAPCGQPPGCQVAPVASKEWSYPLVTRDSGWQPACPTPQHLCPKLGRKETSAQLCAPDNSCHVHCTPQGSTAFCNPPSRRKMLQAWAEQPISPVATGPSYLRGVQVDNGQRGRWRALWKIKRHLNIFLENII